jgi:hypothetical protein
MRTFVYVTCLFVFCVLGANALVGGDDIKDMVDLARLKCLHEGFPIKDMSATCIIADTGTLGFGGKGTVEFSPGVMDPKRPKPLRVELRKPLNLIGWEAVSVVEVTDK